MLYRRLLSRGFSLIELLVALLITMISISACFKMLQIVNMRAYAISDREGFEAASNAGAQIAGDLANAGAGIRSIAQNWLCHLSSKDQFNIDHFTLLAPFMFVKDDTATVTTNPWIRSDVIMTEYASFYPIYPTRLIYSSSAAYQIILDNIDETMFDPAVGILHDFTDTAATSGFARPCIVIEKTKLKTAGKFYYFDPQISGPSEFTLTPQDYQTLVTDRTRQLENYMPTWARRGGLPGGLHAQAWRNGITLVSPSYHTIISPHIPNFIAWSVEPQTGFLRRKNMLNNSDGGCISDLVASIRGQYLIRNGNQYFWQDSNTMTQFLVGSSTSPGSMTPPVDFSKVIAVRIIVLARNGTYIPDPNYASAVPGWDADNNFDMGPEPNSMPGAGVSVHMEHTDWRHYEWEVAEFIIPMNPVTGWTYTK